MAPITRIGAVAGNPLFTYNSSSYLPLVSQSNTVPYVQLWSISQQFQVRPNLTVGVTYAGQRGLHLFLPVQGTNVAPFAPLLAGIQSNLNFNATTYLNPYGPSLNNGSALYETYYQSLVPYQQFYNNPMNSMYKRGASSNYNGLYLATNLRATRDLTLTGGFTWQKSMDNNSTPTVDGNSIDAYGLTYPQSPYGTLQGDYSVSSFDTPTRVSFGYVYAVPIGNKNQLFGSNKYLRAILGGFKTSGYFAAQSGFPLSVSLGNNGYFVSTVSGGQLASNGAATLYFHLRPNLVHGQPLLNPAWKHDKLSIVGKGYLNPSAFAVPGTFKNPTIGNAPRELSGARSPRVINFDATVSKVIRLNRNLRMEIRADVQDVFNHQNFVFNGGPFGAFSGTVAGYSASNPSYPGTYAYNSTFAVMGQNSQGTITTPRIINIGASLIF